MERLHPQHLNAASAGVMRPRYDRAALRPGIVHLGLGAFARAHLAVVNEAAIQASGDLRWGVIGVSLRRPDTRDALAPQAGLYSVATRDGAADGRPRETLQIIGNLLEVLFAPEDPGAVLERLAGDATRIVSLTITEKGYTRDPASGALDATDADVLHDLAQPSAPRGALGFIVRGLALRRARSLGPLTLLSCDNLPANGDALRHLVLDFAARVDAPLAEWIADRCRFPNAMVDRIVPRTTDADRDAVSKGLGLADAWPVVAEPFLEWVVEDRFANGRPPWDKGGARFVERAEPYERLKLRMVNGSHSALAYLAVVAGWRTVDLAVAVPSLRRFIETMLQEEVEPTLPALPGLDPEDYRARLLQRFANPALQHATQQIAMDGSQKLPQRLLDTLRDRIAAGQSYDRLALGVAGWIHYLRGRDEHDTAYPIADPLAAELSERLAPLERSVHDGVAHFTAFEPVFGELGRNVRFVSSVARHLLALRQRGVAATLEAQPIATAATALHRPAGVT
ncbi:MAG TPA: mannitol dehydrogenase family protein [Burkholderiaceae bacterium]|jgi:fructuronate reductase